MKTAKIVTYNNAGLLTYLQLLIYLLTYHKNSLEITLKMGTFIRNANLIFCRKRVKVLKSSSCNLIPNFFNFYFVIHTGFNIRIKHCSSWKNDIIFQIVNKKRFKGTIVNHACPFF